PRRVGLEVAARVALDECLGVLEQRPEPDRPPGPREAEIAERDDERLDVIGIEEHEVLARRMAVDEYVGTAPAAQEASKRVGAVRVQRDLAELDDLRLAIGLEDQGGVGAVDQR